MNTQPATKPPFHRKKILLVEDGEEFYRPIKRWLSKEGYHVTLVTNLKDAKEALATGHFHVAVIDIMLEKDPANRDGLKLLEIIEDMGLSDFIPRIMLTASVDHTVILKATQVYGASYVVKEPGYAAVLKDKLRKIFAEDIKINFDLQYEIESDQKLAGIAQDVKWADDIQPPEELLTEQIKDIIGKLYFQSTKVYIRQMTPGLTGASILRVEPGGKHGYTAHHVLKIGRKDKVKTEDDNYDEHVRDYLPRAAVQVNVAYTSSLGGILYSFLADIKKSFDEFDDFYKRENPAVIIKSLQELIFQTCALWYNSRDPVRVDLRLQYYDAFHLEPTRLLQAFASLIPDYDRLSPKITFPPTQEKIINPLDWMEKNREDFILVVFTSITHGDLTGRNIMVDSDNKCWLIDFYRTYPSHILRDFVILETDIKYRLMPRLELADYILLETTLASGDFSQIDIACNATLPPAVQKSAKVIHALRHMAARIAMNVNGEQAIQKEYVRSLLMATLNVIRLRHIDLDRKLQALYATHMICYSLQMETSR